MKATASRANSAPDQAMVGRLQAAGFDGAVIFTVYSQNPLPSALLCHLAEIPLRLAHCREHPYQLLTDWVRDSEPEELVRHETRRKLDLVATRGRAHGRRADEPPRSARRAAYVPGLLDECRVARDRPWLLAHPGATAPSRRYPPKSFAAAIHAPVAEHGWQVVLTGTESERALWSGNTRTLAGVPAVSLVGALGLAEMAASCWRARRCCSPTTPARCTWPRRSARRSWTSTR